MKDQVVLMNDQVFEVKKLIGQLHNQLDENVKVHFFLWVLIEKVPDFSLNFLEGFEIKGAKLDSVLQVLEEIDFLFGFGFRETFDSFGPEVSLKLLAPDLSSELFSFGTDRDSKVLLI